MIIVYDSLTGQGKRFAQNLGYQTLNINEYNGAQNDPIFLVTRNFNFGEIPNETKNFLNSHHHKVIGLAVSGNKNWGTNYGAAGDKIQSIYGIPLVLKFEASGFPNDISFVKKWLTNFQNKNKNKNEEEK